MHTHKQKIELVYGVISEFLTVNGVRLAAVVDIPGIHPSIPLELSDLAGVPWEQSEVMNWLSHGDKVCVEIIREGNDPVALRMHSCSVCGTTGAVSVTHIPLASQVYYQDTWHALCSTCAHASAAEI